MKKPSEYCKRQNQGYLGHFLKDVHLNAGHNTSEKDLVDDASEKRRKEYLDKAAEDMPERAKFFEALSKAFEKRGKK